MFKKKHETDAFIFKSILFIANQNPNEHVLMDIGSIISTLVDMLCKTLEIIFEDQNYKINLEKGNKRKKFKK